MAAVGRQRTLAFRLVFQSLFWWIGDGGHRGLALIVVDYMVSILVLVDWRWRHG